MGDGGAVRLTRTALDAMLEQASRAAPRECCGLLVGQGRTVDEVVPTANVAGGNTRYQVDPRAHFALIRRLRGSRQTIVGAYHSHPASPARPSPADIREAFDPLFLYVIVSLAPGDGPTAAAFLMDGAAAEPVPLELR